MSKSESTRKDEQDNEGEQKSGFPTIRRLDRAFENFGRDMERTMRLWPSAWNWDFPSFSHDIETRMALCDLADMGDRFELQLEVPGIEKEKIDVKATKYSVQVSGQQSEKTEEKGKNYIYNERKFQSFGRRVPVPEEIVPSKVSAKMNNGIITITLPKKTPTKVEEDSSIKVEVK